MLLGVFIGIGFIGFTMYAATRLFSDQVQDVLVKFMLMVFAALVGVFIVDKVIAFKVKLLADELNNQLFELIKTLILMIFSYYFGTQKGNGNVKDKGDCDE